MELVVTLTIVSILSAISIPYIYRFTQKYKSEGQAIKVMDLMREAGQLALTRRRVMRVELDQTDSRQGAIRIIDENGPGAADDALLKSIPLEPMNEVRMDVAPAGAGVPTPPAYAGAVFVGGVWSARFDSDGTVVNAADLPINATLYFWPPKTEPLNLADRAPREGEVRGVTLFGGTGALRYWRLTNTGWVAWE